MACGALLYFCWKENGMSESPYWNRGIKTEDEDEQIDEGLREKDE